MSNREDLRLLAAWRSLAMRQRRAIVGVVDVLAEVAAACDSIPQHVGFRVTGHAAVVARGLIKRIEHLVTHLDCQPGRGIADDVAEVDEAKVPRRVYAAG